MRETSSGKILKSDRLKLKTNVGSRNFSSKSQREITFDGVQIGNRIINTLQAIKNSLICQKEGIKLVEITEENDKN